MSKQSTGALILAAGTASRMGTAKQLLNLGEKPMLAHVIEQVLGEPFSDIIAVIGHQANNIQETIPVTDERFRWVLNDEYHMGQGTSLKRGMGQISKHHSSAMVFLGDLPFISQETIHGIYETGRSMLEETKEPYVVQPSFQGTAGHPVFFGNMKTEWFEEIEGDQGAKAIMGKFKIKKRIQVEDQGILFDIDTPEAYQRAVKQFGKEV